MVFEGAPDPIALPEQPTVSRKFFAWALGNDKGHGQLLAAVDPGGAPTLQWLDPVTLETKWTLPAPSTISRLAVSDDGSTAYALLPSMSAVWQVDLTAHAGVRTIVVADSSDAPRGALDVAIRPGAPGTFAVAIGRLDIVSPFERLRIYDNGVPRAFDNTQFDPDHPLDAPANEIEFIDADHLVSIETQSTACTVATLSLVADGVKPDKSLGSQLSECFGYRLLDMPGRILLNTGIEFDPDTLTFKQAYYGSISDRGSGVFHTGLNGFIRVNDVPGRFKVLDYENERLALRHGFRTSGFLQGPGTVLDVVADGASRIAISTYDELSGEVTLLAYDLASIPTLDNFDFTSRQVTHDVANGLAIRMPATVVAFDPSLSRLVVGLPSYIGLQGNALAIVDPNTGQVERRIELPGEPYQLAVSRTGSKAYVSLRSMRRVVQIDLATGTILRSVEMPFPSILTVKEDDPDCIAVFHPGYWSNISTLTTYRNLVPYGPVITAYNSPFDVDIFNWIGTSGPNRLLAMDDNYSPSSIFKFDWGLSGLSVLDSVNSSLANGSGPSHSSWGRLNNGYRVVDPDTGNVTGSLDGGDAARVYNDAVLTSPSAAAGVTFFETGVSSDYALHWLAETLPPQPLVAWPIEAKLIFNDNSIPTDLVVTNFRIFDLGKGRLALKAEVTEDYQDAGPAGFIYVFARH